jgi:hypothetical protein
MGRRTASAVIQAIPIRNEALPQGKIRKTTKSAPAVSKRTRSAASLPAAHRQSQCEMRERTSCDDQQECDPCIQSLQHCCVLRLDELHQDWTTYRVAAGATLWLPKGRLSLRSSSTKSAKANSKGPGVDLLHKVFHRQAPDFSERKVPRCAWSPHA